MALSAFSFPAHVNSVTSLEHPQKFSLLSSHFLWRTDLLSQSLDKINQVCITHYILRNESYSWSKFKSFSFHDGSAKFQSCFMVEVNIEKESTKILCLPFVFIFNFWSATLILSLSLSLYIYICMYIYMKRRVLKEMGVFVLFRYMSRKGQMGFVHHYQKEESIIHRDLQRLSWTP
jgi:hypothetical protein